MNDQRKIYLFNKAQNGVMTLSVTEITTAQADTLGFDGYMSMDAPDVKVVIGNIDTGHKYSGTSTPPHSSFPLSGDSVIDAGVKKETEWTYGVLSREYNSNYGFNNARTVRSLAITGTYTYRLVLDFFSDSPLNITVVNGDPNNISVQFPGSWKGPTNTTTLGAKNTISSFIQFKLAEEQSMLTSFSEFIVSSGQEISKTLGAKYQGVANTIAADIKNFQGKKIRNIDQAMASLNKVLSNPGMKINAGDKTALLNAWNHLNATDMAFKMAFLGKAFFASDIVMKIEKARQKVIEGLNTGNWKGLMLEVESWVLSGMGAGIAMGILASLAPAVAALTGIPLTAVTIIGILIVSILASLIDDKLVDKINNEVIRPAH